MGGLWWLGLALGMAASPGLSGGLTVTVVPDEPLPRLRRDPVRVGPVPVGQGPITVDGTREARWDAVPPAPALLADARGGPVPELTTRWVTTGEGVVALVERPEGTAVSLLLDPDGARQRWWIAEVPGGGVRHCQADGLPDGDAQYLPDHAVPCRPADPGAVTVRCGETVCEVLWAWEALAPWSSRVRVLVEARGPQGARGTWAWSGRPRLAPYVAVPLAIPQPRGRLVVTPDPVGGAWTGGLERAVLDEGPWTWTRWWRGRVVDEGTVGADGTFTLPDREGAGQAVTVRLHRDRAMRPGFVTQVRREAEAVSVVTPVAGDELVFAWQLTAPRSGVPLVIEDGRGRVLGETRIDLPAGTGVVRVMGAWRRAPGPLRVGLGTWLDAEIPTTRR